MRQTTITTTTIREALEALGGVDLVDTSGLHERFLDAEVEPPRLVSDRGGRLFHHCGGQTILALRPKKPSRFSWYIVRTDDEKLRLVLGG